MLPNVFAPGMLAGLSGAACLTGSSLAILPFTRHVKPCLLMLTPGCLLGGLVTPAFIALRWSLAFLILYSLWQAGYATALGTAMPPSARSVLAQVDGSGWWRDSRTLNTHERPAGKEKPRLWGKTGLSMRTMRARCLIRSRISHCPGRY